MRRPAASTAAVSSLIGVLPILVWGAALVALPLFPSQDGGSHLATARALLDWLRGDPTARALVEPTPLIFTNWGATSVLTGAFALGLSTVWAERLLLFATGAAWIVGFAAIKRRLAVRDPTLESPAWAAWLALPFLLSTIALFGFWSFLLAVGLGLLAIGRRDGDGRRGTRRTDWHLWLVLAIVAHPLGGLLALGVLAVEDVAGRAWRHLRWLGPHGVLWLVGLVGPLALDDGAASAAGDRGGPAAAWPDWSAAILHPMTDDAASLAVRVAWLGAIAAWIAVGLARASRGRGTAGLLDGLRLGLAVASAASFVVASVGPDALGGGALLRPRFALLGWALALLASPLPSSPLPSTSRKARVSSAVARGSAIALSLAVTLISWSQTRRLAIEQEAVLAALPAAPGPVVASSYGGSLREGARYGHILPAAHLGSRWAARVGALDVGNYQLHVGHFPLRAQSRLSRETLNTFQWWPDDAPWEALAPQVDAAVLVDPPRGFEVTLGCRLEASWTIVARTAGAVVLVPRSARDPSAPGRLGSLRVAPPLSAILIERAGSIEAPASYRCRPWRAFVVDSDGSRPADGETIEPIAGVFDRDGRAMIERLTPPPGARIALQPQ